MKILSAIFMVVVLFQYCTVLLAQELTGGVRGRVMDADFDAPLMDVSVRILELDQEVKTGEDGFYLFTDIPAGTYTLTSVKPGFTRVVKTSIAVAPGQLSDIPFAMRGEYTEMEEMVVRDLVTEDPATEAGLLNLREQDLTLQDSISGDFLRKAGASDAAGALKLVVGASIVDGKFATVRGLSDRYVGAALNGIRIPSADPRKRAVQLDLFPAGTIRNLSVSKSFSPELPGDYTGGGVNIETISIPEERFLKLSFSRETDSDVHGRDDFISYPSSGIQPWARHGGRRDAPPEALRMEELELTDKGFDSQHTVLESSANPHSAETLAYDRIVRSFDGAMGTERRAPADNFSVSASAGDRTAIGNAATWGWIGAFSYSRKSKMRRATGGSYTKPNISDPPETNYIENARDIGTDELSYSQLLGIGLQTDPGHSLDLTYLRTRVASDRASYFRTEYDPDEIDFYEQQQAIHYTERSLNMFQLRGSHAWEKPRILLPGLRLDWYGANARTEQEEPDVRFFENVVVERGEGQWEYQPRVDGSSGADDELSTRVWRNTQEKNSQAGLQLEIPFERYVVDPHAAWAGLEPEGPKEGALKFGWSRDWTRREYRQSAFYYVFASQAQPVYTGPARSDFPSNLAGLLAYRSARNDWLNGPEGDAFRQAEEDVQEDTDFRTLSLDTPNGLWTDVFTDAERLGTGRYQDSMRWYILPKFRDINYTGDQSFHSGYVALDMPLTRQLTFSVGGRFAGTDIQIDPESDLQGSDPERAFVVPQRNFLTNENGEVSYFYTLAGVTQDKAAAKLRQNDLLRSAGLTYELMPSMNLRVGYGQTIARPTFLELAPVITYNYIEGEAFIGNNELELSRIDNFDVRWEWFPRPGEVFAVSWFRKDIDQPIEKESFGYLGQDYLLAVNYPNGEVTGAEFEFRKTLDFFPGGWGEFFSFNANYTLMDAKVRVPRQQQASLRDHDLFQSRRDMEGQPSHLANVGLTFDHPGWGTSVGLFFNRRGDMLKSGAAVGDDGATPNIYSLAENSLTLSISKEIGPFTAKIKFSNLTEERVNEAFREPDGTQVIRETYPTGLRTSFSLGGTF